MYIPMKSNITEICMSIAKEAHLSIIDYVLGVDFATTHPEEGVPLSFMPQLKNALVQQVVTNNLDT